jgi:lipopolysaccharide export system permease protein
VIPGFSRIERYVLRRSLGSVGVALGIIAFIILLIDFVELWRTVGVRAKAVSIPDIFGLALLQSPSVVLALLPFAFLFGVLAAYVGMNRRSELIAIRAAGISAWRFILPAAFGAAMVGVLTVTALNPVAAAMNAEFQHRQTELMTGYLIEEPKPIWLRQGDGRTQTIIRAKGSRPPGVHLVDVSLFIYRTDDSGALQFQRRIDANEAFLSKGRFRLVGVSEATPGQSAVHSEQTFVPSTLDEATALERFAPPEAIPFWSLPGVIFRTERAGFSAASYRLQLHKLLATPVLFAAMAILAAAFSLRLLRLGGLARLSAAALGLGFGFFFINQLCGALGRAGLAPTLVAAWSPPALTLLAGVTLLFYTEDG